jgi:hypothetical protein
MRFIVIILLCLLVGPVVGSYAFFLPIVVFNDGHTNFWSRLAQWLVVSPRMPFMTFSSGQLGYYPLWPAVLTGVTLGFGSMAFGRRTLIFASPFVGAAFAAAYYTWTGWAASLVVQFTISTAIASLVCAWLSYPVADRIPRYEISIRRKPKTP